MNKKLNVFLLVCLAIMIVPAYAFAAATAVTVSVDGKAVKFTNAPVRKDNATMVEAKPLAAQIGATYAYDTKSSTATIKRGATVVKLTVGSKSATVNNAKKSLLAAPSTLKGYVIVPAEFVVQSFGGTAKWDGKSTLTITSPAAIESASQKKAVEVVKSYIASISNKDLKAMKATWLPSSWNAEDEADMKEQFEEQAAKFTVKSAKITSFKGTSITIDAVIRVEMDSQYALDEVHENVYVLVKDSAGVWKIKSEEWQGGDYDLPQQPAAASADFSASVNDLVEQYANSLSEENLEAIKGMFAADSMSAADEIDYWTSDFEDYDSLYTPSDVFLFAADENNGTASVLVSFDVEDEEDYYTYESVLFLKKDAAGKWMIQEIIDLL
ncbi:copper amine oxidase N-terminal domain-containing protein [Paenibacillus kobensis]|uniref:copper amine oxidase N-terminal domain-containing protein n=1 Tax=Paenibacillus kobensis TaxID=59841 RepID=UPI000FDA1533|nr:copper amine oxidase N-terminal domain-containing protein [Paenibacillus kobensis]